MVSGQIDAMGGGLTPFPALRFLQRTFAPQRNWRSAFWVFFLILVSVYVCFCV